MLLLVQLITEVLQYVVTVTPVFFHFDKHFQKRYPHGFTIENIQYPTIDNDIAPTFFNACP